jgi:hypothetical protein
MQLGGRESEERAEFSYFFDVKPRRSDDEVSDRTIENLYILVLDLGQGR